MQINGVYQASVTDNLVSQSAINPVTGQNEMAVESNPALKNVAASDKADASKSATEKEKNKKKENGKESEDGEFGNISISYEKHEGTGEMMIKVTNKDTGEIIREIPPKKILDALAIIWKNAGITVDKKA